MTGWAEKENGPCKRDQACQEDRASQTDRASTLWGALLAVLLLASPGRGALAGGLPVIDAQSLFQEILQAERALVQVEQQAEAYVKQIEQLAVAVEQRDAMRGSRGVSALLNGPEERRRRRGVPETLAELFAGVPSENAELARIRRAYGERAMELDLVSADTLGQRGESERTARAYERERRATLANLALSEKGYDDRGVKIRDYERLLSAIDEASDLKASADLANRIAAENGLLLNELLRMQSLEMSAASAARANALVGRSNLSGCGEFDRAAFDALADRVRVGGSGSR